MNDWTERVNAYADGELGEAENAEVRELLANDPQAAAEHQWAVYLRSALAERHVRPDHEAAWAKAKERLDEIDAVNGDQRVERFVTKYSWGFAAALLGVILLAGSLNRGAGRVSSQEIASAFTGGPFMQEQDVNGADDADRLVQQQLGTNLPAIEPLIAVTHVATSKKNGHDSMRIDMVDSSGTFNLLIFDNASDFENLAKIPGRGEYFGGVVNGLTCVGWIQGRYAFIVTGARSIEEMVGIADDMRN